MGVIEKVKEASVPFLIGCVVTSLFWTVHIKKIDPMENIQTVNVIVDGVEKEKAITFVYNGDVYLSRKDIETKIGKQTEWNGKKETLYIGKVETAKYMSDVIEPYYISDKYAVNINSVSMQMGGKQYNKGYYIVDDNTMSFNLDGQYNSIKGLIGLDDSNNSEDAIVEVYGDSKLIKKYELDKGSLPKELELDVQGVLKLDIKTITNNSIFSASSIDLVDMLIK